ncbi:unnamed protein product, partial [Tetraodon nigroviridis]
MAEGACQRENELRAELQRLQQEVAQLQDAQSQDLPAHCEHCDVEWIKKAGDEQVNLALAYTELTEELGRVRDLAIKQSDLLRQGSQEPVPRSHPAPQRLSPTSSQRTSLSPDRLLPAASPPLSPSSAGPASYSHQPTSSRLRAKFQGRRSYSEVSDPSAIQRAPARLKRDPVSTLPKPRSLLGEMHGYGQTKAQLRTSIVGLVHHFCHLDNQPEPTPLVTPPQSSDDEEVTIRRFWACKGLFSLQTLGALGIGSSSPREHSIRPSFPSPRKQPHHPSFSAPEGPATLSCHLPPYMNTEHAQSWPSINLWMESEESAIRSCPLCQLTFPTGYPDDALIKHIDSHLENSKI